MRDRFTSFEKVIVPFTIAGQRWSLLFCFIIAFGFLFFVKAEAGVFSNARASFLNVSAPFYNFVGPPLTTARTSIGNVFSIFSVMAENQKLREENARLLAWQDVALSLEQKVRRYEALLQLGLDGEIHYRTARIVSDTTSPFVQTRLVNAGRRDGVFEGQAVVGPDGFVGRIVAAGQSASRVLMLTDLSSQTPVLIEPNDDRGIMIGLNDSRPVISQLPKEHKVEPGSRVVTSGDGGLLPSGIVVGFVTDVRGRSAQVKPASALNRLTYVRILDYSSPVGDVPRSTSGPAVFDGEPLPIPEPPVAAPTAAPGEAGANTPEPQ